MSYRDESQKKLSQSRKYRQKRIIMPKIYDAGGDPSKRWHVFYSFRDPDTGKMKRFRPEEGINRFTSLSDKKKAAQDLARKYKYRLENEWSPFDNGEVVYEDALEYKATEAVYGRIKHGRQKLIALISEFLEEKKPPVSKLKTYQSYQSKFRIFSKWLRLKDLSDIHPSLFTEDHAKLFFRYLLERRRAEPATYNKYRTLLRAFFSFAKSKRRMRINPIDSINPMKESRNVPLCYNQRMQDAIVNHLKEYDPQLLIVVKFIYYTFVRPGELRLLKIKNINFWDSTVTIPADVSKNRKEEKVTIPEVFLEELEQIGWHQLDRELYLFSLLRQPGKVPVGKNYFSIHYRKCREALGIGEDYQLYTWKHTGASVALQTLGIDLESLRRQLRHSDLKDTQRYASALTGETSAFKKNYKKI